MTIATVTNKQLSYPYDKSNAAALKTLLDALVTAGNLGTLAGNALSADETGRAVMQTGYLTEEKATDAFAAQAITGAIVKNATLTEGKLAPSIITGKHVAVGAAGNTVGILPELFVIDVPDGNTVLDAVTLDATYGKISIKDIYFIKGATTGGTTDAVQVFADSGGSTTPVSSSLALNTIAEGGVVRTTSLLNTTFAAGAHIYVKRTKTTNNSGTLMVLAYRIA